MTQYAVRCMQYQGTVNEPTLQRRFSGERQFTRLSESVLNRVLGAQVSEQLHAERDERTEVRQGLRNGDTPRQLTTRVGTLTLRVPQVHEGGFSTELFARYPGTAPDGSTGSAPLLRDGWRVARGVTDGWLHDHAVGADRSVVHRQAYAVYEGARFLSFLLTQVLRTPVRRV